MVNSHSTVINYIDGELLKDILYCIYHVGINLFMELSSYSLVSTLGSTFFTYFYPDHAIGITQFVLDSIDTIITGGINYGSI